MIGTSLRRYVLILNLFFCTGNAYGEAYLCHQTSSDDPGLSLRTLFLQVDGHSEVFLEAVVEGFMPPIDTVTNIEPFSVVAGEGKISPLHRAETFRRARSQWKRESLSSAAKQLKRHPFPLNHLAIPVFQWSIPSLPPMDDEVSLFRLVKDIGQYVQKEYIYKGHFLFPVDVVDSEISSFPAHLYLQGRIEGNPLVASLTEFFWKEAHFLLQCEKQTADAFRDAQVELAQQSKTKHLSDETVRTDMSAFRDALFTLGKLEVRQLDIPQTLDTIVVAAVASVVYSALMFSRGGKVASVVPPEVWDQWRLKNQIPVPLHPDYDIEDLISWARDVSSFTDDELLETWNQNPEKGHYILRVHRSIKRAMHNRQKSICLDTPWLCTET